MSKQLEETFGSDFVDQFQEQVQERRRERQRITDEQKAEIAHEAINNAKFKDGDPTFQYKTENGITHDVLLMMLPDPDGEPIWNRVNKLESGAVTCPLDYMGQWWSCLFNEPEDLERMEPGEYYIVIGEQSIWEADSGQEYEQVSPVRGVLSLEEARQLAEQYLDAEGGINEPAGESQEESMTEPEDDDDEEEEESSTPSFASPSSDDEEEDDEDDGESSGFLSDEDNEEEEEEDESPPVTYDEVAEVVEALGQKDSAVWEVNEGDERLGKLTRIVAKRLDLDTEDRELLLHVKDLAIRRINEEGEEEDEDDSLFS